MKKQSKKRTGKVVTGTAAVAVIAALAIFAGKGFGFGTAGSGDGTGENGSEGVVNEQSTSASDEQESDTSDITVTGEEIVIKIEVKKSEYFIDGEKKTLSEVELVLRRADAGKTTFILEDNYASAKAWSEVRELFTNLEISVIEQ